MTTLEEAADLLRCAPRTVSRAIAAGRLLGVKVAGGGARVLVPRAELARFLTSLGAA